VVIGFKDKAFLNFFFSRMEPNNTGAFDGSDDGATRFKWLSRCGKEMNFIEVEDKPVVFHKLVKPTRTGDSSNEVNPFLLWGGDLKVSFDPGKIHVGSNGRVYHPGPKLGGTFYKHASTRSSSIFDVNEEDPSEQELGLIKSSVVVNDLVDNLDFEKMLVYWNRRSYPLNKSI
jgi:hypothetical protein